MFWYCPRSFADCWTESNQNHSMADFVISVILHRSSKNHYSINLIINVWFTLILVCTKCLQPEASCKARNVTSTTAAEIQNPLITAEILNTFFSPRHHFLPLYPHKREENANFCSKISNRAVLTRVFNHIQVDRITCSGGFAGAIYIQGWLQVGCHLHYQRLSTNETPGFRP